MSILAYLAAKPEALAQNLPKGSALRIVTAVEIRTVIAKHMSYLQIKICLAKTSEL